MAAVGSSPRIEQETPSASARSDASREARAARLSDALRGVPPLSGYGGHQQMSRNIAGQTWRDQALTAREAVKNPAVEACQSEAWTRPQSVRHAGRVLVRGPMPRMDVQDLLSREECRQSGETMNRTRERCKASISDPLVQRAPPHRNLDKFMSYDPGDPPKERINPATLEPAGVASISRKFDILRLDAARREKAAAHRNNEILVAIRR
mmetsp:Transcript_87564/g.276778  ORF Transcript_87564/g.276778 Transcript_87564/m.276778 type:complete len:209 (-) Transcript_87564:38-664(-)